MEDSQALVSTFEKMELPSTDMVNAVSNAAGWGAGWERVGQEFDFSRHKGRVLLVSCVFT